MVPVALLNADDEAEYSGEEIEEEGGGGGWNPDKSDTEYDVEEEDKV